METSEISPKPGNFSRKVVAIAAGEAHTLALAEDGFVYAWGRGMFGRLGTGSEEDELFPTRVKFDSRQEERVRIVGVAAGAYHSLCLADDGSVWSWGYNIYGQLGVSGDNSAVPRMVNGFNELRCPVSMTEELEKKSETPLKVCSVKAGGLMSLAIDNLGALWMWGNCPRQGSDKNEVFSFESYPTPIPIWDFQGRFVVKVACGNEHVIALVGAGETSEGKDLVCYSWGGNNHGQLGLGDQENRLRPQIVETFNQDSPWTVYEVACGAFHTALLTRGKRPNHTSESMCWTFGLGDKGQLGHGTTHCALVPEPVKQLPQQVYLTSVDCGLFHTSVVSSAGDAWSWGMEKGLGLCPEASFACADSGDAVYPLLVSCNGVHGPKFLEPVQVACGAAHTVLVAENGFKLWSWGRGRSGVLGNGNQIDCYTPTLVLWPPPTEEFMQEESKYASKEDKAADIDTDTVPESDGRLSLAMEEIKSLQLRLTKLERYASILHGSIFGKPFDEQDIPSSLRNLGSLDIAKEWENMLESADRGRLVRLQMFYRNMLAGVEDTLMKRRVKEIIQECLQSSASVPRN